MKNESKAAEQTPPPRESHQESTLGAGCFWCLEAVLQQVKGVSFTLPGYAGGEVPDPSYKEVCTGTTGHAEVVRVHFDPAILPFRELLRIFWRVHDPTQRNGQGADIGPQYRSTILYHNEEQREEAERYKKELNESEVWQRPVVTEIAPCHNFYPAEEEHRGYFEKNPEAGYCRAVIIPKLEKFQEVFGDGSKAGGR